MFIPPTTTPAAMLTQIAPSSEGCSDPKDGNSNAPVPIKISVVGAGTVGTAIAYTILVQGFYGELVLIDKNESIARGEILDMQNAGIFLDNQKLSSSSDYATTENSRLIILTAGVRDTEENKERATVQNTQIYKEIVPEIIKHSPEALIIVCSFPVDEMSFVAWKLSGIQPYRVIGIGTHLETSRFRAAIAQKVQVHPSCVRAFIIGEQGSKSFPIWSSVNVAGIKLMEINPEIGSSSDPENWNELITNMRDSTEEVECLKECASWGMALSVARIVKAILKDTGECFTISTRIKGCRHGVEKDVFLSLPVILGCDGVKSIIKQVLNEKERQMLQCSADRMYDMLKTVGLDDMDETDPPAEGAPAEAAPAPPAEEAEQ